MMKKELDLTEDIIRNKDPKCYAVWHHRRWVFKQWIECIFVMNRCPSLLDPRELSLCEALLKLDQRNFHCWNHWMLICNMMNLSTEERLAFTMKRIEENPSNYSAWHFRCELINTIITEANAESIFKEG